MKIYHYLKISLLASFTLLAIPYHASAWAGEVGDGTCNSDTLLEQAKVVSLPVEEAIRASATLSLSERNCPDEIKSKEVLLHYLEEWKAYATSLIGQHRSASEAQKFLDSKRIIESIENYLIKGYAQIQNVIVICDQSKLVRSLAIVDDINVSKKSEHDALEIILLANNPHNFPHPKNNLPPVSHAGEQAIRAAINRSIDRGHEGKIVLEPTDGARPFYSRIGFQLLKTEEENSFYFGMDDEAEFAWPDRMILSSYGAKRLLSQTHK